MVALVHSVDSTAPALYTLHFELHTVYRMVNHRVPHGIICMVPHCGSLVIYGALDEFGEFESAPCVSLALASQRASGNKRVAHKRPSEICEHCHFEFTEPVESERKQTPSVVRVHTLL